MGDTVNIYNHNGDGGEWGRLDAGSTFRMKRELDGSGNNDSGSGNSGGSGSGTGGGSRSGTGSGGGFMFPVGGSGGGSACRGGESMTCDSDGCTVVCHQN